MTQVPRPQWLSGIPVAPGSAPAPVEPSAAHTASVGGYPGEAFSHLFKVIGANLPTSEGTRFAADIADAILTDPALLKLLSATVTDSERNQHARLWNAVASALTAFCAENGYPGPYFSARNRVATRVWRELHPDSSFDGPADGDPAGPLRRGRKPETPEGEQ